MIDIGSMYPDAEDLTEAFNREMAVMRDSMSNMEQLFKRILQNHQYISDEEVAGILRCKVNEIPQKLVRYRPSRAGYVYKLSDVIEFVESKKIGG